MLSVFRKTMFKRPSRTMKRAVLISNRAHEWVELDLLSNEHSEAAPELVTSDTFRPETRTKPASAQRPTRKSR